MNFVKRISGFDVSLQIKKHVESKYATAVQPNQKNINDVINYECFWEDKNSCHYEVSFCHHVPGRTEYWSS